VVVLISPAGAAVRMKQGDAYTVRDGTVFFTTPPPAGWIVAFEMPETSLQTGPGSATLGSVVLVIYPDGTMRQVEKDPWELLLAAQEDREEAKKLLRDAKSAIEAAERVVHVESEVAKEKLSARLEKYGSLVEDSIKQSAAGARDELRDYLGEQIEEVRTKHDETVRARASAYEAARSAEKAAERAAARTEETVKETLEDTAAKAVEAYERTRAMKSEILDLRDEAKNAATVAGNEVERTAGAYMNLVIEEVRSMKNAAANEMRSVTDKSAREAAGLVTEIKATRDAVQAAANRALEVERRVVEMDRAQVAREEGMKALWAHIASFKKTFEARVAQMRGSREGEQQ
jgi:hypothetical protein